MRTAKDAFITAAVRAGADAKELKPSPLNAGLVRGDDAGDIHSRPVDDHRLAGAPAVGVLKLVEISSSVIRTVTFVDVS